ncbi:MAG TPA: MFS transporter [Propionibacteriaceae bacterium]|nr:MFS transporter [Propionibacteriaceae bacterium]
MFVLALAYLAFASLALPPSMLGVVWPSMRLSLAQPLSAAGLVPPVGVLAGLVSTTLAPYLVRRFGVGRILTSGTLGSVASLAICGTSATMWQFLAGVVVGGLSAAAVDTTLNVFAARTFGPRQINLMHASYGVGAAVSPLIVTVIIVSGASWRWSYVIVGALQLVVALVFAVTRRRWDVPVPEPAATPSRTTRVWSLDAILGMLLAAVQNGIEAAVAIWAFTYLTGLGTATVVAGGLASGYWLTLVVGRVGFGSLAERIGPWRVMGIAVGLLLVAAVLADVQLPAPAMAAVLLFGVGAAPMYPLLVLTTAARTSHAVADRVIAFQAAASSIGNAITPGLIGLAIGVQLRSFGWALAALCLTAAMLLAVMHRRVRARPAAGPS